MSGTVLETGNIINKQDRQSPFPYGIYMLVELIINNNEATIY